jgi:glutathione S-transferase
MAAASNAKYELYYWPSIQGRGELIRLPLEAAGAAYVDVARLPKSQGGGVPALMAVLEGGTRGPLPFAPPILKHGRVLVAQTAAILQYLAPRLGLVPKDEASRLYAHQLQLTVADFLVEVHDTHHPIGVDLYYEDQGPEAKRRSDVFLKSRLPKFVGYFERVLERNRAAKGRYALGSALSYVDLSFFQVVAGLEYAFPREMARRRASIPLLRGLCDRVMALPRVAAYLASPRRIPFNEHGIFRHYPELDT